MRKCDGLTLGERLRLVAGLIRGGARVADVGTDHALVPIFLVLCGKCGFCIATDIAKGPIERARENIEAFGLAEKIQLRQCFGLEGIFEDEVDDVVIAGMGGENIAEIIDRAIFLKNGRINLVLQPMTKAHVLREYLYSEGFDIVEEKVAREDGRLYVAMRACFDGVKRERSLARLYIGDLDREKTPEVLEYIRQQRKRVLDRLRGLRIEGAAFEEIDRFEKAAAELQEILAGEAK